MSTWFSRAVLSLGIEETWSARIRGAALVASSGALLSFASLAAFAAEITTPAVSGEASILVATRDSSPAITPISESTTDAAESSADSEPLEPISQVADVSPDLAPESSAASNDDASEFGAALAKVAETGLDSVPPTSGAARPSIVRGSVPYEPATFSGIMVGETTKTQLIEAWGQPAQSTGADGGAVLTYDKEPFQAVEVLLAGDKVEAIKVALAANLEPAQLAKQLALDQFEPVIVSDEAGQSLGQAFPERGVLFMFNDTLTQPGLMADAEGESKTTVSHVVIQPLDARAFALRAENRLHGPYEKNIKDLRTAISLDPEFGQALWLLAEVYLATGQADLADTAASEACNLEPKNASYQMCRSRTLALSGEYDEAVHEVRAVLDRDDIAPIVRAQALHEMARLASLGDVQIAAKAIPFETKAIEIADKVATSKNDKDRRAAKQLLVEAHLAIAEEIARQAFNNKVESMSMWIGRASGLAEDFIANDDGSVELRLKIAQSALTALASFKPTLNPAPWVSEAEDAAKELFARSDDTLWHQHVKWEMGSVYLNALRVEHLRQQPTAALNYGQQAIENLAEGATSRQAVHSSEQLVGSLYFYMGAVSAVHHQDHKEAAQWYDKATPLLTSPRPVSELYSPRREGEVLVSMGVTYWQTGQQSRALELTQSGANLVELAVEDGILGKAALAVPYGNLASMYEQLGEATNATKYAALAETAGKYATPPPTPRTGRIGPPSNTRVAAHANMQQATRSTTRR